MRFPSSILSDLRESLVGGTEKNCARGMGPRGAQDQNFLGQRVLFQQTQNQRAVSVVLLTVSWDQIKQENEQRYQRLVARPGWVEEGLCDFEPIEAEVAPVSVWKLVGYCWDSRAGILVVN